MSTAKTKHGKWFENYLIKKHGNRFVKNHCDHCSEKGNAEFDLYDTFYNTHVSVKYIGWKGGITHGNLETQINKKESFIIICGWYNKGLGVEERMNENAIKTIDIRKVDIDDWLSMLPSIEKFNEVDNVYQTKRNESTEFHSLDYDDTWETSDFPFIIKELSPSRLITADPKRGHNQKKNGDKKLHKDGSWKKRAQWRIQSIQKRWQLLGTGDKIERENYGI